MLPFRLLLFLITYEFTRLCYLILYLSLTCLTFISLFGFRFLNFNPRNGSVPLAPRVHYLRMGFVPHPADNLCDLPLEVSEGFVPLEEYSAGSAAPN